MINTILNKYLNNEKDVKFTNYTLENINKLLQHLNNPHYNFKSIHIAGTNGKGSTAFMLSAVLQRAGYKTGLYTSPHLIKINERIKINSSDIDDSSLYYYLNEIDSCITNNNSMHPTYFDILTAAAFKFFSDESIDIAVIETGLGGRLDSTNVIIPEISIITDISLDHIDILGNSISKITKEKCGIIKSGVPVITSNIDQEIVGIIEENTQISNSKLYLYKRDFYTDNIRRGNGYYNFDYFFNAKNIKNIKLSLFPEHQVKNASLVLTALFYLKDAGYTKISDELVLNILERIIVPGRFQLLSEHPLIIYDPAHNFDSLNNLIKGLDKYYTAIKKTFIISMMKDKADLNTVSLFKNLNSVYFLLNDVRAYSPEQDQFQTVCSDKNKIIDIIKKSEKDNEMFIFTGTFRIYDDTLDIVKKILKIENRKNRLDYAHK